MVGQYIKTPAGRKQYDMMKLNIPVFGLLNRKVAISRFCRTRNPVVLRRADYAGSGNRRPRLR